MAQNGKLTFFAWGDGFEQCFFFCNSNFGSKRQPLYTSNSHLIVKRIGGENYPSNTQDKPASMAAGSDVVQCEGVGAALRLVTGQCGTLICRSPLGPAGDAGQTRGRRRDPACWGRGRQYRGDGGRVGRHGATAAVRQGATVAGWRLLGFVFSFLTFAVCGRWKNEGRRKGRRVRC